jgi:hypothetical protein
MRTFTCRSTFLYRVLPKPPRQCLASACRLSTLNLHYIAVAGLPFYIYGWRCFLGAKKETGESELLSI